ncbi:hypothetical protein [Nocardia sp. 348MFTsu5.1]|nr:hypothetical protein [Nocardia sp. 348MFTsu5.1]
MRAAVGARRESGHVLVLSNGPVYDWTVAAYDEVVTLVDPHRY